MVRKFIICPYYCEYLQIELKETKILLYKNKWNIFKTISCYCGATITVVTLNNEDKQKVHLTFK